MSTRGNAEKEIRSLALVCFKESRRDPRSFLFTLSPVRYLYVNNDLDSTQNLI